MRISSGIAAYHRELLLGPSGQRSRAADQPDPRSGQAAGGAASAASAPVAHVVEGEVLGRHARREQGQGHSGDGAPGGGTDPFAHWRAQGAEADAPSASQRRAAAAAYQAHAAFVWGSATATDRGAIDLYA